MSYPEQFQRFFDTFATARGVNSIDISFLFSYMISSSFEMPNKLDFVIRNKDLFTSFRNDFYLNSIFSPIELFFIKYFSGDVDKENFTDLINEQFELNNFEFFRQLYYFIFLLNRKLIPIPSISERLDVPFESYIEKIIDDMIQRRVINRFKSFDNCVKPTAPKVLVISSIFSPNPLGAHYNLTMSIIKTISLYHGDDKGIEVGLALSGESSFKIFDSEIRSLDISRQNMHLKKWLESGYEKNNLFIGCGAGFDQDHLTRNFFCWVDAFGPDLILCVGDAFESKFYRKVLYERYPIAFFPMAVGNDPKGFVDGVLCKKDIFYETMSEKKYDCVLKPLTPIFDVYLPPAVNDLYNFRRRLNDVVFVTPLHGDRVSKIFQDLISDSEIESFYRLFEFNENFCWVLVGQSSMELIFDRAPKLKRYFDDGRITCLSFVENLRSVFAAADCVFVIPKMTGGNQGICTAMADGLAVVSSNYSDSAGIAPKELTYNDMAQMEDIVNELCSNSGYLNKAKISSTNAISQFFPSSVANEWGEYIKEIIDFGNKKRGLSNA